MRLIIPGADFSVNAIDTEKVYTLYQGFAGRRNEYQVQIGTLSTRVRTSELQGSYTVKTKTGFVIRAIVTYGTSIDITGDGDYNTTDPVAVSDVQGLTEYTLSNPGGYSLITFCKTDATQDLSPTDDIVAELY